jgi:hypothetical protein
MQWQMKSIIALCLVDCGLFFFLDGTFDDTIQSSLEGTHLTGFSEVPFFHNLLIFWGSA